MWMGNTEFVEMMDMRKAEDDRREEDDGRVRCLREYEKRDSTRAEENLLCNWAL